MFIRYIYGCDHPYMSVYHKVKAVEKVFSLLEKDIEQFKEKTGLGCLKGCGECCKKPDIEASVLEFLPYAYYLYKNNQAFDILDKLEEYAEANSVCFMFSPFTTEQNAGFCSQYQYRGLICRLFGFSAYLNKYGVPQLSTCRLIKESSPDAVQKAGDMIEKGDKVPVMRNYYFALMAIDPVLTEKRYPINQAIVKALQEVCFYYSYRGKRSS